MRAPGLKAYRPCRAFLVLAIAIVICTLAAAALTGCAGELPVPGKMTTTGGSGIPTTTTLAQTVALGKEVAATWQEAIERLVAVLRGTPPIASIQSTVADMKEEYVQRLVGLGRQINELQPYEQQSAYDRSADILASTAGTDWFLEYKTLYEHYAAGGDQESQDFAVLLSTFNTLTQYAFFDVLKVQEPEEAARLGVE